MRLYFSKVVMCFIKRFFVDVVMGLQECDVIFRRLLLASERGRHVKVVLCRAGRRGSVKKAQP